MTIAALKSAVAALTKALPHIEQLIEIAEKAKPATLFSRNSIAWVKEAIAAAESVLAEAVGGPVAVPDGWRLVVAARDGLTSNGVAVALDGPWAGWVFVRHADGVNWTSAAKLTPMTLTMLRNYPPPQPPLLYAHPPRSAEPLPAKVREAVERMARIADDPHPYTCDCGNLDVSLNDLDTIRAHILGSAPSQAESAPKLGDGLPTSDEWDRDYDPDFAAVHGEPAPSPEGVTDAPKGDPDDEPFPEGVEFGIGITRTPRETYWIRRARYWRERATTAEAALSTRTEPAPAGDAEVDEANVRRVDAPEEFAIALALIGDIPAESSRRQLQAAFERLQSELAAERAKVAVVERARDPSRLEIASMQMSGVWAEAADDGVNVTREDCAAEALLRADALIAAAQLAATPTRGDGG